MTKAVNSYRFLSGITKRMVKSWIKMEQPRAIPWTPLDKPLSGCTVSLLSSAGIALKTDQPFEQEGKRRNPWLLPKLLSRNVPDGTTAYQQARRPK